MSTKSTQLRRIFSTLAEAEKNLPRRSIGAGKKSLWRQTANGEWKQLPGIRSTTVGTLPAGDHYKNRLASTFVTKR